MLGFILRRLLTLPLVFFTVYAGAVLLLMATPGDSLESGSRDLPPEVLAQKRIAYNYDQPWYQRYFWTWPRRLVWDQDLPAHQYEDWTVVEIIRGSLPVSLQLGVLALGLALLLGIASGVAAGVGRGRWFEHITLGVTLLGVCLPTFVIGIVLLLVFGMALKWAPVGGWGRPAQLWLPAITLALPYAAYIARLMRSALRDVYAEDYIRTARAKGLSETRVLLDHALQNALLPVLSYVGPAAASIFTGSFVVERVFTVPGIGTHVVESINNRDQTLILATVMIYAAFLATFNLLVDVLYGVIDPRIRIGARQT
ncbi:Oligopeptide transport system permease protein OppB [Phycisphaerae bacterium RAS1]|nr:Oligopeptide transport system permease protein OppB [Phycisphaerae bacterium RAS1]